MQMRLCKIALGVSHGLSITPMMIING